MDLLNVVEIFLVLLIIVLILLMYSIVDGIVVGFIVYLIFCVFMKNEECILLVMYVIVVLFLF